MSAQLPSQHSEYRQGRLIVDAMNVIGSRPTGWWRDRDGAVRRLVARLQKLSDRPVTVVVDGRPLADLPEGEHQGVRVIYASRPGRDAADDRIVELLDAEQDAPAFEVVTSDRALAERVRSRGGRVSGPQELLARLDRLDGGAQ